MEARAELRQVRISPRKVGIVLDLIRNKPVGTAVAILQNTPKAASLPLEKLVKSAVANAEHNFGMDVSKLYIKECYVGPARMMKRVMPRAKGSADRILRRTCHVTIAVKERA